jgi:hypothetical protein
LPTIYQTKFLKRLLALKILNNDGSLMPLCNKEVRPWHFMLLMDGRLSDLSKIYFHWPSRAIYYLFRKLMENGASFNIKKLERPIDRAKIFMCDGSQFQDDCLPFSSGAFYTYMSEHTDKERNLNYHYPEIDDLL